MTAAPVTATCTAQVTDQADTWGCTGHLGIYHVADLGPAGLRLWLDPDDQGSAPWEAPMIAQVRAEIGDDMPSASTARVEAIGSAAITIRAHSWAGGEVDGPETRCGCGWRGDDHERHIAEQLWATGALDRDAAPVRAVLAAATALAARLRGRPGATKEVRALVAAVDAHEQGGQS